MYISKLAVPIEKPSHLSLQQMNMPNDYFFHPNVVTLYEAKSHTFAKLHDDVWLFLPTFMCSSLDELKRTRQILRPSYMNAFTSLPCIDLLESLQLTVASTHFDKAYGHALHYVEAIDIEQAAAYMNIANYDGDDDPVVSSVMHYIENTYAQQRTLFVAGVETKSFATITENRYYADVLWRETVGQSYVLLFAYYCMYGVCPSDQMMPKLLCNVWASTTACASHYNPNLYKCQQF